jgi:hypothetical protein
MNKLQELAIKAQVADVLALRQALRKYEQQYGLKTEGAATLQARLRMAEQVLLGMVISFWGANHADE